MFQGFVILFLFNGSGAVDILSSILASATCGVTSVTCSVAPFLSCSCSGAPFLSTCSCPVPVAFVDLWPAVPGS